MIEIFKLTVKIFFKFENISVLIEYILELLNI